MKKIFLAFCAFVASFAFTTSFAAGLPATYEASQVEFGAAWNVAHTSFGACPTFGNGTLNFSFGATTPSTSASVDGNGYVDSSARDGGIGVSTANLRTSANTRRSMDASWPSDFMASASTWSHLENAAIGNAYVSSGLGLNALSSVASPEPAFTVAP